MDPQASRTSPLSSPTSTSQHPRFSLRSSLSSTFKASSIYSQSSRVASGPGRKPDNRSRLQISLPGSRIMPTNFRTPHAVRSRSSTRSIIDASILPVNNAQPLSLPRVCQDGMHVPLPSPILTQPLPSRILSGASIQELVLQQDARRSRRQQAQRKRRYMIFSRDAFRDPKVRLKATMSFAFGFTLVTALAVYLGLSVVGIGSGPMYHTLFILLILALTAVFCHSLLRMFMCILYQPGRSRHHRGGRRAPGGGWADVRDDPVPPEKPIRVIMASDEDEEAQMCTEGETAPIMEKLVIRPPPPIYGEYKDSTRMNPSLVYTQKQTLPPSPLTPTYDEAMTEICVTVGYRPPSYIIEGSAIAPVTCNGAVEIVPEPRDEEMEVVHPLERERIRGLIGVAV